MDVADQLLRSQPFLVLLRPIGAVGTDFGGNVVRRHQPRQHPAISVRCQTQRCQTGITVDVYSDLPVIGKT